MMTVTAQRFATDAERRREELSYDTTIWFKTDQKCCQTAHGFMWWGPTNRAWFEVQDGGFVGLEYPTYECTHCHRPLRLRIPQHLIVAARLVAG